MQRKRRLWWHWNQNIAQVPPDLFAATAWVLSLSGTKRLWWAARSNEGTACCCQMRKCCPNSHINREEWQVPSWHAISLSDPSHPNDLVCISASLLRLPGPWGHRQGLVYLWIPSVGMEGRTDDYMINLVPQECTMKNVNDLDNVY